MKLKTKKEILQLVIFSKLLNPMLYVCVEIFL